MKKTFFYMQKICGSKLAGFALLALPTAILLAPMPSKAVINVNIFDEGPNLKVEVTGTLAGLPTPKGNGYCGLNGYLAGQFGSGLKSLLCSGPDGNSNTNVYAITGPAGYGGNSRISPASAVSGSFFMLIPSSYNGPSFFQNTFSLDQNYVPGQPFFSSSVFNGTNLAAQGFMPGPAGTWSIDGTAETINVFIGPAAVPGPLPLFGAGAAYAWSRRLRRRISAPVIMPPKA